MLANFSVTRYSSLALCSRSTVAAKSKCSKIDAHVGREALDVAVQVGADVVLVAHELAHVERRDVVEVQPGLARARRARRRCRRPRLAACSASTAALVGCEHAVQAAQHGERQDDPAVLALLEVAAQQVGDRPDEGGEGLLVHGWRISGCRVGAFPGRARTLGREPSLCVGVVIHLADVLHPDAQDGPAIACFLPATKCGGVSCKARCRFCSPHRSRACRVRRLRRRDPFPPAKRPTSRGCGNATPCSTGSSTTWASWRTAKPLP